MQEDKKMKCIKSITINDGYETEIVNSNYLFIQQNTRTETILQTLMNSGWNLLHVDNIYNPNILQNGSYPFFSGGIKVLFEKEITNENEDNFNEILTSVIKDFTKLNIHQEIKYPSTEDEYIDDDYEEDEDEDEIFSDEELAEIEKYYSEQE